MGLNLAFVNSNLSLMPNKEELLKVKSLFANLNARSRKPDTLVKKTRRIFLAFKPKLNNFNLRSSNSRDLLKNKKKLLTATCQNTESSNTNLMKLKKELILLNPLWPNLELARISKLLFNTFFKPLYFIAYTFLY